MTEEPDDGKTQAEHDSELRQAVKDKAADAIRRLRQARTAPVRLDDAEYYEILQYIGEEVTVAWAEYHNTLAAEMKGIEAARLAELYQAVRDSVETLKEAISNGDSQPQGH
jgi:hypothetical protein